MAEHLATEPGVRVVAWKEVDGTTGSDGLLVTMRDGGPASPEELRGTTLCYPDSLSRSGWDLPRAWLRDQGVDPNAEIRWHASGNHEQALRDVIAGTCAGTGTWSVNFTSSAARGIPSGRLRVLANIGTTRHDAVVVGPGADPDTVSALQGALLRFDPKRDAPRREPGSGENVTGFVAP
jgi:ABC-type phosphate/phosphonate transport system substrate-binding protein